MHGGEPIHWFLSRTYLKQTKSFNDGSDKYFCCNTTKHNGNSANIIHTQNAHQVTEKCNELETDWWNYTQNLYAATFPDQLLKRKLPTAYIRFVFFNAAHSPSRYTIITWVYLVLWILCKFVESSKQIYLIQTKYTHGGFWRSTRRDLDLKELDVYWAFNLLLNI